jgi:hypothetical protein
VLIQVCSITSTTSTLRATAIHSNGHVNLRRTIDIWDDNQLQNGVSRRRGLLTSRPWIVNHVYSKATNWTIFPKNDFYFIRLYL